MDAYLACGPDEGVPIFFKMPPPSNSSNAPGKGLSKRAKGQAHRPSAAKTPSLNETVSQAGVTSLDSAIGMDLDPAASEVSPADGLGHQSSNSSPESDSVPHESLRERRRKKCPFTTCDGHTPGFSQRKDLCRHLLEHYEWSEPCSFCEYSYQICDPSNMDDFRRHLISFHGADRYEVTRLTRRANVPAGGTCPMCSATFDYPQHLLAHLDDCVLEFSAQYVAQNAAKAEHSTDCAVAERTASTALPSSSSSTSSRRYNSNSEGELSFVEGDEVPAYRRHLDRELDDPALNFIAVLAWRVTQKCLLDWERSHQRQCAASHSGSGSSGSQPETQGTPATSLPAPRKRWRQDGGEDDHEGNKDEGDDSRMPNAKRECVKGKNPAKLLACPYAKFDPDRYSERNQEEKSYRSCASKYLNSIPRVKQHLYRVHGRPQWYCGNCYRKYKTRELLNEHARVRPPCENRVAKFEETMTDEQYNEVKRRSLGSGDYASWYGIFRILFPFAPPPPSPYVSTSDPAMVNHFVDFFRWYGPEELLEQMRERKERGAGSVGIGASTQTIIDEAFEVALPEYLRAVQVRQLEAGGVNQLLELPSAEDETNQTPFRQGYEGSLSQFWVAFEEQVPQALTAPAVILKPTLPNASATSQLPSTLPNFTDGNEIDTLSDREALGDWLVDPIEIGVAFETYNVYADTDLCDSDSLDGQSEEV